MYCFDTFPQKSTDYDFTNYKHPKFSSDGLIIFHNVFFKKDLFLTELVYKYEYTGYVNIRTIKECNFFGAHSEYVVSGSDDGMIYIWKKKTSQLVQLLKGDKWIVNCIQGHPLGYPILATSGIENNIKIWVCHSTFIFF